MKKKILVVDDELIIADLVKGRLESSGYEVIVAHDGLKALDMARSEKPDLIILDLMLPKLDGYKVCRLLKFDEKYKKIPIIMFTARTQEEDKRLGQEMGCNAYIVKPFEPDVLLAKVKELVG